MIAANLIEVFIEHVTLQQLLSNVMYQRRETWFYVLLSILDNECQRHQAFLKTEKIKCQR